MNAERDTRGGEQAVRDAVRRFVARHRGVVRRLTAVRVTWVALGVLLVLCAMDALFALSAVLRALLDVGLLCALVAIGVLTFRRHVSSVSPERMVARLVEKGHPELENRLVNAIDFDTRLRDNELAGASPALMRREIDGASAHVGENVELDALRPPSLRRESRVLLILAGVAVLLALVLPRVPLAVLPRLLLPGGDFPPYSPTRLVLSPAGARIEYGDDFDVEIRTSGRRPTSVALAVMSLDGKRMTRTPAHEVEDGVYAQRLERVTDDLLYFASIPGSRSKRCRLQITRTPRIDAAHVRYEYPPYTRRRPQAESLSDGLVRAFRGTRVTLTLTSNRPLAGGGITVGDEAGDLAPAGDSHSVRGTFVVRGDAAFEAVIRDTDGNECREPLRGRVRVIPDKAPEVNIVSPGRDSFATPTATVPIEIEVRDDIGVARIHLYRNHNDSRDYRKGLYDAAGAHSMVQVSEALDLADLGVRPGDEVDYYASAVDSAPDEPHTGASRSFKLRIISEEEYARFVRARMTARDLRQKYAQLMDRLAELAEEQEQVMEQTEQVRDAMLAGEQGMTNRLARLRAAQGKLADTARELAEQYEKEAGSPSAFDIEDDFKRELAKHAELLRVAGGLMSEGEQGLADAQPPAATEQANACLAAAFASQSRALAVLRHNRDALKDGIDRAAQDIEELFALYRDVAVFKYLLERQRAVARQSRFLAKQSELDVEDRVRLKELAEEQADIRQSLTDLKNAFREHAVPVASRYPSVADDARNLAARIEELGIEALMGDASHAFGALRAEPGHEDAQAAYDAMLTMVDMCSGAGGRSEGDCELRLRITMGMSLGNTFPQLGKGLGLSQGMGIGGVGVGADGFGGSVVSPFGLYGGSDTLNDLLQAPSPVPGSGGRHGVSMPEDALDVAPDVEELELQEKSDVPLDLPGGEHIMEEYRRAIIRYFSRMAEE